jgi:hypothetical protein
MPPGVQNSQYTDKKYSVYASFAVFAVFWVTHPVVLDVTLRHG